MLKERFIALGIRLVREDPENLEEALRYLWNTYGHEVHRMN